MRPVSPKEIEALPLKAKVILCELISGGIDRRPAYVYVKRYATRIEVRYLDDEGRRVLIPWSLLTNKPINDPKSKFWLEHFEEE